ncbi:membrane protein [Limnochorda pilosa]|uniref:Membrane protein n=1 Tax=Limnochorda pilosa TaxID=1555112 RepID=A0A0K2SI83_LIMPI|nr:membrane protein [Limnochorda pilosa]
MPAGSEGQPEPANRGGAEAGTDDLAAMETWISRLLQLGVLASAAVIALGVILWAATGETGYAPGTYPLGFGSILAGVLAGRPLAVIQVGLVLLVLTPIFRVGAAVLLFHRQGDRAYTLITLAVFLMLAATFLAGGGGG